MIPAALGAACADVRPAGPDDFPAGLAGGVAAAGAADGTVAAGGPAWVACPASVEEAGVVLAAAADLGLAVVVRGTGTRQGWGLPPRRCDLVVDTGRLDAVLEHAAGDQVVRVQAGVRLSDLARVVGQAGQRLALDPPGPDGTVGGLIATGAAGPLRLRYGTPRDLLLGVTMVRADGVIARSGGKVVKNVAGYDIGKLLAGSYGTLGLIAEATFRLHPAPARAAWVSLDAPGPAAAAAALLAVAGSKLAPSAAELDWPGAGAPVAVAVLLEGEADGVAERAARAAGLLAEAARGAGGDGTGPGGAGPWTTDAPPPWWGGPVPGEPGGTLIRVAFWAGRLAAVLGAVRVAGEAAGVAPVVGGSGPAGVLHAALGADAPADGVAAFVTGLRAALGCAIAGDGPAGRSAPGSIADGLAGGGPRASVLVVQAPEGVRARVDLWGAVPGLALMRAVKDQFDPGHRMAPGRFAGGM